MKTAKEIHHSGLNGKTKRLAVLASIHVLHAAFQIDNLDCIMFKKQRESPTDLIFALIGYKVLYAAREQKVAIESYASCLTLYNYKNQKSKKPMNPHRSGPTSGIL
jgi:hypothetical protein